MLHPELKEFLARLETVPATTSIEEKRRAWREFCLKNNHPRPAGMSVWNQTLPLPGREIALRWYIPEIEKPHPCVIYLHGGGWVLGDLDTQDTIAWGLARGARALAISVNYRRAPEHPYPAAFDDSYAVLEHVAEHADRLGIDPSRIALCGDSAGGNLAAAVCLAARDRQGPKIAAQALLYPVTDTDTARDSYLENADSPLLTLNEMEHFLEAYLGQERGDPDGYAMPLRAEDLSGLPPAFVHTAEFDPLRDEGHLYYRRLREAGNEAEYRFAEAMPHSFARARFEGAAAKAEFDAVCAFLQRSLHPA
jgi:acetyl esterase